MSAITGIFYRNDKTVKFETIKKMNDKMSHRGPDGSSIWFRKSIGFGHQTLFTTLESLLEKLPYEDEGSGLVITADARIDNRKELSTQLDLVDNEYISDSYYIIKAYEKWGENCPEYLLGDFAFAIWDEEREKLFCARDHMGIKPFYYYMDENIFIFGTEIKSLFEIPNILHKKNNLKIAEHFSFLFNDKTNTFYDKISRLPQATKIALTKTTFEINEYWKLDVALEIKMDNDEEYTKSFYELFAEAVNCRLRSQSKIGSLLSGGIDSSSVVCTARKLLENKNIDIETYSAIFKTSQECDESYFINKVIQGGNIKPHFIEADKISPLYDIETILWHLEEPMYAPNFFFHWFIHQKAGQNDVRVILEGFDGDTTLSHAEYFLVDYLKNFQWIKGIKEFLIHSRRSKKNIRKMDLLISLILPFIPSFFLALIRKFYISMGKSNDYLVNKELFEKYNVNKRLKQYQKDYKLSSRSSKNFHYFKLSSSGLQINLEAINKSAAAAGVEARFPFFDKRLVEFCLALPLEQKINNGWTRYILRNSMENILPEEVQWRSDKGMLGSNFRKNFLLYEKTLINNILFNKKDLFKNYVDIDTIQKMYFRYISNKSTSVLSIFGVIAFAIWNEKIFKRL